jgi:ATP phosphoribosyltransferase regulatory subunit
LLNRAGVTRLCYCGNVLHARPSDLLSSRELLQIGAEIYGHAGFEADLEIIQLVLETVAFAGVRNPRLDLNHPGVLRAVLKSDPAAAELAQDAIRLMRDKDVPGLGELAARAPGIRRETLKALQLLPTLYGGQDVLKIARRDLPALPGIAEALDALQAVVDAMPNVSFSVDLADVGGYAYHSGVKFALYAEGWHDALVSGGRYDDVSHAFGRSRPATGFSLDLRKLAAGLPPAERARAVRAPWGQAPALTEAVRRLRRSGEIVVQVLPGHEQDQDEFVCDRELALQDGVWTVKTL